MSRHGGIRRRILPRLGSRGWLRVGEAVMALATHGILLRLQPPASWLRAPALPVPAPGPLSEAERHQAAQVAHAVRRAARLTGARCLAQALAARTLLARRGIAGEIRIGAASGTGPGRFHAWCLCDGAFVTGAHPDLFRPFATAAAPSLPDA